MDSFINLSKLIRKLDWIKLQTIIRIYQTNFSKVILKLRLREQMKVFPKNRFLPTIRKLSIQSLLTLSIMAFHYKFHALIRWEIVKIWQVSEFKLTLQIMHVIRRSVYIHFWMTAAPLRSILQNMFIKFNDWSQKMFKKHSQILPAGKPN